MMTSETTTGTIGPTTRPARMGFAAMRRRALELAVAAALVAAAPASAQETTAICHATGDSAQPFMALTVGPDELLAHLDHEDDLIPAPAAGCPGPAPATAAPTPAATPSPAATPVLTAAPTATPAPARRPRRPRSTRPTPPRPTAAGRGGMAQVVRPLQTAPVATAATPASPQLPYTGSEPLVIAMLGAGFVLGGAGLRLSIG
jgi:hypothetical protein